jgi:O-acetylserine/cysteine efflux transporter
MPENKNNFDANLSLWGILLALLISFVWGFNFIIVKIGLEQIPPLTLCALRFLMASLPAVFFIPKPDVSWKYIIAYGLMTFALQFSLLFLGMSAGVAPGVAALILQLQVFFAIFFAYLFMQQTINRWQLIGAVISFLGIFILAWHHDKDCSLLGFTLILGAAISWGLGTIISAKLKNINMLSLVVWSSFVAVFPLFGMALLYENPIPILLHPNQLSTNSVIALVYITYLSTYFGYGYWSWLLSKYPIASIAPFALLAPIVAMIFSALIVHESIGLWKGVASLFVVAGLCLNIFNKKIPSWLGQHKRDMKTVLPNPPR